MLFPLQGGAFAEREIGSESQALELETQPNGKPRFRSWKSSFGEGPNGSSVQSLVLAEAAFEPGMDELSHQAPTEGKILWEKSWITPADSSLGAENPAAVCLATNRANVPLQASPKSSAEKIGDLSKGTALQLIFTSDTPEWSESYDTRGIWFRVAVRNGPFSGQVGYILSVYCDPVRE